MSEGEESFDDERVGGEFRSVVRGGVLLSWSMEETEGGFENVEILGEEEISETL